MNKLIRVFLIIIGLGLASCAENENINPSSSIIGEWKILNLKELNERRKKNAETNGVQFDPFIEAIQTFYLDGTGRFESKTESEKTIIDSFTYGFVLNDQYKMKWKSSPFTDLIKITSFKSSRYSEIPYKYILQNDTEKLYSEEPSSPIELHYQRVN